MFILYEMTVLMRHVSVTECSNCDKYITSSSAVLRSHPTGEQAPSAVYCNEPTPNNDMSVMMDGNKH